MYLGGFCMCVVNVYIYQLGIKLLFIPILYDSAEHNRRDLK